MKIFFSLYLVLNCVLFCLKSLGHREIKTKFPKFSTIGRCFVCHGPLNASFHSHIRWLNSYIYLIRSENSVNKQKEQRRPSQHDKIEYAKTFLMASHQQYLCLNLRDETIIGFY